MKILVLYYTKSGHTLEAITPLVEGLRSAGSEAEIVSVKDFKPSMISDYDSLIVGTPCWAGSIGLSGAAGPVVNALKKLPDDALKGKRCGGIAVHALAGGEAAVSHLKKLLSLKGCEDFRPGPVGKAGTLGSVMKGPSINAVDADRFKAYGMEFAT